jgi:tRNA(adenine34) deaminase
MTLTHSDEHFMKAALKEAETAFSKEEVPVGAVVVCNNTIIARSHNLTETLNDPTAHAEMQVITAATSYLGGKYLNDCTLFVTLEPCLMCAGALFWSQLGRLVYGATDEKRGFTLTGGMVVHPKTAIQSRILENDCSDLLRRFFKKKR